MKKGEMLSKMLLIATNAHAGQFDKQGQPYILHPLAVMHKLHTDDEELKCIAIGHDVVEDNKDITYEYLRNEGMSERVIDGIRNLTKIPGETQDEYKKKVFSSIDSMLVKREDLRTNMDPRRMKGITQKDIDRSIKYTHFYYEIEQYIKNHKDTVFDEKTGLTDCFRKGDNL